MAELQRFLAGDAVNAPSAAARYQAAPHAGIGGNVVSIELLLLRRREEQGAELGQFLMDSGQTGPLVDLLRDRRRLLLDPD